MRQPGTSGFSLVELLVALVFTMVLMAGMANVYKASLSAFYTSGESISSTRRNRMSVDLLVEDLNQAGMFLTDLASAPPVTEAMPVFLILPNMPVTGHGDNDPLATDELYFYQDQPLPFEGTLASGGTQLSAIELVARGTAVATADTSYTLDCGSAAYASQVAIGQVLVFKDAWQALTITADLAGITGGGAAAPASQMRHLAGSRVLIIQPAQMVRYRIQMLQLDPGSATGIPCLVRDQGDYNPSAFTATQPQQIIAENVAGFAAYLSTDGGTTWAGWNATDGTKAIYSDYGPGWDTGIRTELDTQLLTSGRPGAATTRIGPAWFRTIPVLVRVDVTTRTATRRSEYAAAPDAVAHRLQTQSLVLVPRHSGLALN
ncbi:MAG: hypothetical protein NTW40_13165 [Acidobacteria bacterium]|nr:hypothetical protein [Acidobacteriota bacterium]